MSYDEETGEWTSVEKAEGQDTIWQVPVIKKTGLSYGTYTVEVQVVYMTFFDQDNGGTGNGNYYFVLDSVRVYDPANGGAEDNDTVIEDAYKADGETNPHYLMIKDAILDAAAADTLYTTGAAGNGVVFIDGIPETNKVNDYTNPGPNNEAYLAQGQSISFKLKANATPLDVQIGLKVAYGGSANVQFTYTAANGKSESKVRTFKTTTDMYYSIASYLGFVSENQQSDSGVAWTSGTITLTNTSNAIISLTNVKATFKNANYRVDGGTFEQASAPVQRSLFSFLSASAIPEVESAESGVEETVPVSFTFLADAEVIEAAGAVMNDLYAPEPVVFVPAYLKSVVDSAWFGYETIQIVTSHDVASVTVNGVAAEKLTYTGSKHANLVKKLMDATEKSAKKDLVAENYDVWTVSMKRATEYSIVAYDENGAASDASVAQSSAKMIFDRTETYSIMEDLAKQEFAPDEFKTQVNERQDGTQEIITQTSEDVEYVVIDGKIVRTYITKTVIDLETGEEKTVRVWIVATEENGENEDDVSVNAYDKNGVGSKLKKAEKKNGKKLESDKIPGNGKNELFDKNWNNGNKLSSETGKKEVI